MKKTLVTVLGLLFILGMVSCFRSSPSPRPVHDNRPHDRGRKGNMKQRVCVDACKTSKRQCIKEAKKLKRKGKRRAAKEVCKEAKKRCVKKCRRRY